MGKQSKVIIILGASVLFGAAVIFKLFGFLIWPELEFTHSNTPSDRIMFRLDDERAMYTVLKYDNGTYVIQYSSPDGPVGGITAFIGSAKVDLEGYVNKKVRITGSYRKTLGDPLCWKEGCEKTVGTTKEDVQSQVVIDIDDLIIYENH